MTLPNYQEIYKPLLEILSSKQEYKTAVIYELVKDKFNLTDAERSELLPSGNMVAINNRCLWSLFYLKKAGLVKNTRRGIYQITESGFEFFKKSYAKIDNSVLLQIPDFNEFLSKNESESSKVVKVSNDDESPLDRIEKGFSEIKWQLIDEIIDRLKSVSPSKFEHIVLDVILKMGYGGSRADAGQVVGKSGDGGIDGVINEDKLGLDTIYIQAKRWDGVVGRPEVQKFVGALQMHRSKKGIFITTSGYTSEALN